MSAQRVMGARRVGWPRCWTATLGAMLSAVPMLSGCTITRAYRGAPLRAEPAAIIEGQSTRSDVLHLFGPPDWISHQTNGDAFLYRLEQQNSWTFRIWDPITRNTWFTYSRQYNARDALLVLFDFTGVVRAVGVEHHIEELPVL